MVNSKLDEEESYAEPRSKILDSIDMSKRKSKLLDFLFWTGLAGMVGISYGVYELNSYINSRRHNNLPEEVRKYDTNEDGFFSREELSSLLENYVLRK